MTTPISATKASSTPWHCHRRNDGQVAFRISATGLIIADVLFHETNQHIAPKESVALANAQLIVDAVNSHDALVAIKDAAKEYTTERGYQNMEHCRKDQDRLEQILLDALANYDSLESRNTGKERV